MKRDLYRFMKYRRELEQINEIGNRILKHQLKEKLKQQTSLLGSMTMNKLKRNLLYGVNIPNIDFH